MSISHILIASVFTLVLIASVLSIISSLKRADKHSKLVRYHQTQSVTEMLEERPVTFIIADELPCAEEMARINRQLSPKEHHHA